jgi:hypothetical protein
LVIEVIAASDFLNPLPPPEVPSHKMFRGGFSKEGAVKVSLEGGWLEEGFQLTMGELLCANVSRVGEPCLRISVCLFKAK